MCLFKGCIETSRVIFSSTDCNCLVKCGAFFSFFAIKLAARGRLGCSIRKPIKANPGLKVNGSIELFFITGAIIRDGDRKRAPFVVLGLVP